MLNNITIQGRLTRSPEMQATENGVSRAKFTLACEQDYKNQNRERDTDFFDVVAWRGTADFVQRYFSKGQMVVVKGRLQTRQWTAEDGSKRKTVQIVADNIYFCGRESNTSTTTEQPAAVEEPAYIPVDAGELPF